MLGEKDQSIFLGVDGNLIMPIRITINTMKGERFEA